MPHWKTNLLLSAAVFSTAMFTNAAFAQDEAADTKEAMQAEAEQTSTITGTIALPQEVPDWYLGEDLSLKDAVIQFKGEVSLPRYPYPSNHRQMTREEYKAWSKEFKKTEAYVEYHRKVREAYENQPIFEFPVNADGTFKVTTLKPGQYSMQPLIPHARSAKADRWLQSWASDWEKRVVVPNSPKQIRRGTLNLQYRNVVMPGDTVPQFTAKDMQGNSVKLSDFKGKYVVLDFWATWCPPCIAESPTLKEIYKAHGGDQFEIVAMSLDDKIEAPIEFLGERPSPYTQLHLGKWGEDENVTRDLGIANVPAIWLIGPDGKLIARDLYGQHLKDTVNKTLNNAPATN